MEEELHKKKCIPCEGNIPPFDIKEIHKYLKKINGWEVYFQWTFQMDIGL